MKRVILETFLGILFFILGIYIAYVYISDIDTGSSPWLLGLAIVFFGFGIFCLLRAGKSDDTVIKKTTINSSPVEKLDSESTLKRNNELTAQWKKTMEQRDRLRLLEIAGSGNKSE